MAGSGAPRVNLGRGRKKRSEARGRPSAAARKSFPKPAKMRSRGGAPTNHGRACAFVPLPRRIETFPPGRYGADSAAPGSAAGAASCRYRADSPVVYGHCRGGADVFGSVPGRRGHERARVTARRGADDGGHVSFVAAAPINSRRSTLTALLPRDRCPGIEIHGRAAP